MTHPFPDRIQLAPETWARIIRVDPGEIPALPDKLTIVVTRHPDPVEEYLSLFHELVYFAYQRLKMAGEIARMPSDDTIAGLAGMLFPMLALSGMLSGVNTYDAQAFYTVIAEAFRGGEHD